MRKETTLNLFRGISNLKDNECKFLSLKCKDSLIYIRDSHKNIKKFHKNDNVSKWESFVYIKLLDKHIFPFMNCYGNEFTYLVSNLQSLRSFFSNCKYNCNFNLILYELFSFINTFKVFHFLHGNLHIDNIFVDTKINFYVIDYSNSFLFNYTYKLKEKRSSFIKEFDDKLDDIYLSYWDFFTLYISLKSYFTNDSKILELIDNTIITYIEYNILQHLILKYYI